MYNLRVTWQTVVIPTTEANMLAKLNTKHDYITLTITHQGLRANFTVSRRGEKVSASGPWTNATFQPVAEAFLARVKKDTAKGSYGSVMETVRASAQDAVDFQDFAKTLLS